MTSVIANKYKSQQTITLDKTQVNPDTLIKQLPILDFLIKSPGNYNKHSKLEYVGNITYKKLSKLLNIFVLKLSYGNTNYAWFLQRSDTRGQYILHTDFANTRDGIVISIGDKKFTLEFLNYYGFTYTTHYLVRSGDKSIELKTIQKNINAFLFLWEQFVLFKESNPETCGWLYNGSKFKLPQGQSVAQPVILQLLGKRYSYYSNHRFCMKKTVQWDNAIREAELVIEYVKTHTIGQLIKSYRVKGSLNNFSIKMMSEPEFQLQTISQFVSFILKNPVIKIEEKDIWGLFRMVRAVLNLPVYSSENVSKYYQRNHVMNSTMRYPKKKKKRDNNQAQPDKKGRTASSKLSYYKNYVGMLPNGEIGKVNNIYNHGNTYTVSLRLDNDSQRVIKGNYDVVLQKVKDFVRFDKIKYLQSYVNRKGIYNKLEVSIKHVGMLNNNTFFVSFNTPGVRDIPLRTITEPSFTKLKNRLNKMIKNYKLVTDSAESNWSNWSNESNKSNESNINYGALGVFN